MDRGYGNSENFTRGHNVVVGLTSTLTPQLLNTFRSSFSRRHFALKMQDGGLDSFGGCLGLGMQEPQCRIGAEHGGLPGMSMSRTSFSVDGRQSFDLSAQAPTTTQGDIFQFQNNLTWIRGSHTMKFGGEVQRLKARALFDRWGGISFQGNYANDGFAEMLLGLPSGLSGRLNDSASTEPHNWFFSGYAQDDLNRPGFAGGRLV